MPPLGRNKTATPARLADALLAIDTAAFLILSPLRKEWFPANRGRPPPAAWFFEHLAGFSPLNCVQYSFMRIDSLCVLTSGLRYNE
jgi:hypothetical protein